MRKRCRQMKKDTQRIDSIEKVLSVTSHLNDATKNTYQSVSAAVMTQLRREKLAANNEIALSWSLCIKPLATCFALTLIALTCSLFYFSSETYDDNIVSILAENSEYDIYTIMGEY